MAAQEVEGRVEVVARVVLAQLLEAGGKLGGADLPPQEGEDAGAERVVHRSVELTTLEVLTKPAVGELVGGVLPDLPDQHAVGALRDERALDVLDELVRELVGHVEAPAARAGAQPLAHHAAPAADELVVVRVVLVERRQVAVAPPARVGAVLVEEVPAAIGRVRALVGTEVRVVPI